MTIELVRRQHFSGLRRISDDTPRSLQSILNELITASNSGTLTIRLNKQISLDDIPDGGGPVDIGIVASGVSVSEAAIEVLSPYDAGTTATIGDDLGPGRLLQAADSDLTVPSVYKRDADHVYQNGAEIRIWFNQKPSAGSCAVTLYLFGGENNG